MICKKMLLENIIYLNDGYDKIRERLLISASNKDIEELISFIIEETPINLFFKIESTLYIKNIYYGIEVQVSLENNKVVSVGRLR